MNVFSEKTQTDHITGFETDNVVCFIAGVGSEPNRVFFTCRGTLHAKDAFRTVLPLAAGIHDIHIHWTSTAAASTGDTFAFIHLDTQQ